MSNQVTDKGKPVDKPLFGENGCIKNVKIINPLPLNTSQVIGLFENAPIDKVRSFINRDTEVNSIKKIIENRKGIDGKVWNPPSCAIIKGDPDKIRYVFDGDHSRHIFMGTYPDAETMPVRTIEVSSKEEINKLFIYYNKTGKTSITAEQVLVNQFHAAEKEAVKSNEFLKAIGAKVYCSNEAGGSIGDSNGVLVSKAILNHLDTIAAKGTKGTNNGVMSVNKSIDLVSSLDCYESNKTIPSSITRALSMIFLAYPDLRQQHYSSFKKWFVSYTSDRDETKLNKEFNTNSGHQNAFYVADGIRNVAMSKSSSLNPEVKECLKDRKSTLSFNRDFKPDSKKNKSKKA